MHTMIIHVAENDYEEFQLQMNLQLAEIEKDATVYDIQYSTTSAGANNVIIYSAIIIFKVVID